MTRGQKAQRRLKAKRDARRREARMVGGWTLDLVEARFGFPNGSLATPGHGSTSKILARQVAGYLMTTRLGLAKAEAGRILRRHESTIWHAVRQVEGMREDPGLNARIVELEAAVDALKLAALPGQTA